MTRLDELLAAYKQSFGGGMIPFDTAYHDMLELGSTTAEAQRAGGHALLEAFVAYANRDGDVEWVDRHGRPTEP